MKRVDDGHRNPLGYCLTIEDEIDHNAIVAQLAAEYPHEPAECLGPRHGAAHDAWCVLDAEIGGEG